MRCPEKKRPFARVALHCLGFAVSVLAVELVLRHAENHWNYKKFGLWREMLAEYEFFDRLAGKKPPRLPELKKFAEHAFDPTLGWRNYRAYDELSQHYLGFPGEKKKGAKKRVIVTGDSYVWGLYLKDEETLTHQLQTMLGSDYEVYNLSVPGFGIDQMAIAAVSVFPEYKTDVVVFTFIAPTLTRSCRKFMFDVRRPYFVWDIGTVRPEGIPVPELEEVQKQDHSSWDQVTRDRVLAMLYRSRVLARLALGFLHEENRECIEDLNIEIVRYMRRNLPKSMKLVSVELRSGSPIRFLDAVREVSDATVSIPNEIKGIEESLGIKGEFFEDGHPKKSMNRVMAQAIANGIVASPSGFQARN